MVRHAFFLLPVRCQLLGAELVIYQGRKRTPWYLRVQVGFKLASLLEIKLTQISFTLRGTQAHTCKYSNFSPWVGCRWLWTNNLWNRLINQCMFFNYPTIANLNFYILKVMLPPFHLRNRMNSKLVSDVVIDSQTWPVNRQHSTKAGHSISMDISDFRSPLSPLFISTWNNLVW